jgi:protein-S-isoprenylcysteine O-methyltransferase Ste14
MLPDLAVTVFLAVCLAVFYSTNLYNLLKFRRRKKGVKYKAEVKVPHEPALALATLGTFALFSESAAYSILVFLGKQEIWTDSWLQLHFLYDSWVQAVGISLTVFGYFLFIWSVLARGRCFTAWEMSENHSLVTWGPYRYVRHPSYLAYFILFTGLFLTLLNIVAIIPLLAIPGYARITAIEEELLARRFGDAYKQYQQETGKFWPKRKRQVSSD